MAQDNIFSLSPDDSFSASTTYASPFWQIQPYTNPYTTISGTFTWPTYADQAEVTALRAQVEALAAAQRQQKRDLRRLRRENAKLRGELRTRSAPAA